MIKTGTAKGYNQKDFKLKGMEDLVQHINRQLDGITLRSAQGLLDASIHIRRDMEKSEPKIPIDTGNLRASWFANPVRGKYGPGVLMGFTANYAVYVHENMEASFKRPGSGAKFLEAALLRNKQKIVEIIRNSAAVK